MRENRNVPFRDWNIRVSRNHNGQLHICAVDICDILKRDELLENGAIARVCPTALKISFRKNGRVKPQTPEMVLEEKQFQVRETKTGWLCTTP